MFQITVVESDPVYARQAAAAALAELEQVDNRLSRYVETSDVFRINRLAGGQATTVHLDTLECLRIALDVQEATDGAFDVAYASAARPDDGPILERIEPGCMVRVLADGVRLDLARSARGSRWTAWPLCWPSGISLPRCSAPAQARCWPWTRRRARAGGPSTSEEIGRRGVSALPTRPSALQASRSAAPTSSTLARAGRPKGSFACGPLPPRRPRPMPCPRPSW